MNTIDKFIGAAIFALAIPLLMQPEVHWSVYLLLTSAFAVYILFLLRVFTKRCIQCGHYFKVNTWCYFFEKKTAASAMIVSASSTKTTSTLVSRMQQSKV